MALHRVADLGQPDDRVGLADRQVHEVGGDAVAERALLLVAADGDRDHRPHGGRAAHRLAAGQQPAAQRAGDGGQDHVVHRAAVGLAHPLVVVELGPRDREPALLADGDVERGGRRRAGGHPGRRGEPADGAEQPGRRRCAGRARPSARCRPPPSAGGRARRPRRRRDRARPAAAAGIQSVVGHLPRRRRDVEDDLADVDRADAVDHRVVGLGDHRDPAVGQTLHQVHLPERAVAVEPAGHQPADQLAQLRVGARARQRGAAYVEGDVEVASSTQTGLARWPGTQRIFCR